MSDQQTNATLFCWLCNEQTKFDQHVNQLALVTLLLGRINHLWLFAWIPNGFSKQLRAMELCCVEGFEEDVNYYFCYHYNDRWINCWYFSCICKSQSWGDVLYRQGWVLLFIANQSWTQDSVSCGRHRVVKEEYKSNQTPQLKKRQQSYLNLKLVNFSRRTSQKIRT